MMDPEIDCGANFAPTPVTPQRAPSQSRKKADGERKDAAAARLFAHWNELIPQLIAPLLVFHEKHVAKPVPLPGEDIRSPPCENGCEPSLHRSIKLNALLFDHYKIVTVSACPCHALLPLLVSAGLFPCSPVRPNLAVSIPMLEFHRCLFEKALDSVNAFVGGLNSFYLQRGFTLSGPQGDQMVDPFRKAMSQAIQWYDVLVSQIERDTRSAISRSDMALKALPIEAPPWVHSPTECSTLLRTRCPACFGGVKFGKSFSVGGDFHVAVDGNFHHRRRKGAADAPSSYLPDFIIPEEQVDIVGQRIASAQSNKGKDKPNRSRVPDVAVDECQHSYIAANGNIAKSDGKAFDSHGLMALVCRHDIPLFAANINTPGEGQKYAVSLIEHFFEHIPSASNVVVLYDVGCVLDRSLHKRDIVSQSVRDRLRFVTSAMHAYGHQWSCQLEYNPRMQEGLGLTDGEGVERLWSQLRMLIGLERNAGASKRIWLLDRHLGHVAITGRRDLGRWVHNRSKNGVLPKDLEATLVLDDCGIPIATLASLWDEQRDAQLSLSAHAPSLLKKEIEGVLKLQSDLDQWRNGLKTSKAFLKRMKVGTDQIQDACDALNAQVEEAYATLKIPVSQPSSKRLSLATIKLLLLLREVKISIRQRATGVFFEMERLDQAVGGRSQALGTRLHQQTRKGISKRAPALRASIRKYNILRNALKRQIAVDKAKTSSDDWTVPIPPRLPEELHALQNCDDLMEDVWIDSTYKQSARWLTDAVARRGIRAMLKLKRCDEEKRRLCDEVDNMCGWLAREMAATEYALRRQENSHLQMPILLYQSQLSALTSLWASTDIPRSRLNSISVDVFHALASHGVVNTRRSSTPNVHHSLRAVDDEIDHIFNDMCLNEEHQPNPQDAEAAILSDLLEFDGGCHDSDSDCDALDVPDGPDCEHSSELYATPDASSNQRPYEVFTPDHSSSHYRVSYGENLAIAADDDAYFFSASLPPTVGPPSSLPRGIFSPQSFLCPNFSPHGHHVERHPQGRINVESLGSPVRLSTSGNHRPRNVTFNAISTSTPARQRPFITGADTKAKRPRPRASSPVAPDSDDDIEIVRCVIPAPINVRYDVPKLQWVSMVPSRGALNLDEDDMKRLMNQRGWLNAACINSLNLCFSEIVPTASKYAIFDTYALVHVAGKVNDEALWNMVSVTRFWEKDVFIIPIHRPRQLHWVLCVARLQTRTLEVFDSFGSRSHWESDLHLVLTLLVRCLHLAKLKLKLKPLELDGRNWLTKLTCTSPVQRNEYDCGLWVVATVASVLRGHHISGLQEEDMPMFREVCRSLLARRNGNSND
ncbi:hypothetical protein ONZ45_g9480 [Pleurotus djamor]|nr:hypothetical protein ONZ45_g9480 [Pleurotus djamor]